VLVGHEDHFDVGWQLAHVGALRHVREAGDDATLVGSSSHRNRLYRLRPERSGRARAVVRFARPNLRVAG
jgi:hypothetical protein